MAETFLEYCGNQQYVRRPLREWKRDYPAEEAPKLFSLLSDLRHVRRCKGGWTRNSETKAETKPTKQSPKAAIFLSNGGRKGESREDGGGAPCRSGDLSGRASSQRREARSLRIFFFFLFFVIVVVVVCHPPLVAAACR